MDDEVINVANSMMPERLQRKELMTLWDIDDLLELIGKNYDGEI